MKKVGDNPFDCKVLLTQLLATHIMLHSVSLQINYTLVILYEVFTNSKMSPERASSLSM